MDDRSDLAQVLTAQLGQGVLAFPLTAFTDDGESVSEAGCRRHLRHHLATGAAALFVACGTGEFASLTEAEYADVVALAAAETDGRIPVLSGIGYGFGQARRLAGIAAGAGIDGLLVMPPYLARGSDAGLVEYVRRIAAGTDLPLIVYLRDLMRVSTRALEQLAAIETVIGFKDGHSAFVELQRARLALGPDFLLFNGSLTAEMQYRPYASLGIRGYSSAVQAFVPEIAGAFFTAARDGDEARMDELITGFYAPVVALRDRVPGYAVSLIKAGARLRGQPVGPVRAPLTDPTPDHLAELELITRRGLALVGADL
ncbi:5-dehydro-4-deoxyglucarate dehydratase [Microlunatus sp. Y2014]|uniref:5-dehydro-4-deoxyglucarate dehydratase n=1 Tax=Microlunatus sp. Y2014 TaxID=3418488 RepID=UPI003DA78848